VVDRIDGAGDAAQVLVHHRADDQVEVVEVELRQRLGGTLDAAGVVRAVEYHERGSRPMTSNRPGQWAFRSPRAIVASSTSATCRASVAAMPALRAWGPDQRKLRLNGPVGTGE